MKPEKLTEYRAANHRSGMSVRLSALALAALTLLGACGCTAKEGDNEMNTPNAVPLICRTGSEIIASPRADFRTQPKSLNLADPMLFDDTARSGYYYVYGTGLLCARSRDMKSWQDPVSFMELTGEEAGLDWRWAPEVIYDAETRLYYAFFSSHPQPDKACGETEALPGFVTLVAVSGSAAGPFRLIDLTDPALCGEENVRTLNREKYPQYYAKYTLLDGESYWNALRQSGLEPTDGNAIYQLHRGARNAVFVDAIDLSPFVDPVTGKKYLYWSQTPGCIAGVEMKNWFTPEWSTFRVLTCDCFYTVEDYRAYMIDRNAVTQNDYERHAPYCNEGPFMLEHNGKYYLTFSVGHYLELTYSVLQAVGDSPLGPFRKLTEEENGILLSCDLGANGSTSGTGHHSFARVRTEAGEKLIMCYHAYNSPAAGKTDRLTRFDEVKWISVTDKDGHPLDVMYLNGPSVSAQPTFSVDTDRVDLTGSIASVTVRRGTLAADSTTDALTDGLIDYRHRVCADFEARYVPEIIVRETTTFDVTLSAPQTLSAIVFYPSKYADRRPSAVTDVIFTCEENGRIRTRSIDELPVPSTPAPGEGLCADFEPMRVLSIRFTVTVPKGQETAALSELTLMGVKR